MKTRCQSIFRAAYHSFDRAVFAGAVLLIVTSAPAQNLFVSDYISSGTIYEFTPGGAQSTYVSGLPYTEGLAFDSAGNLFEADQNSGNIYELTPRGRQSTFASGLPAPAELAFQGEPLPMPEPSALGLLAVGVTALLVRRRNLAV